jgi:aminoglycoside phosphotransferase (APT) family kinase protein
VQGPAGGPLAPGISRALGLSADATFTAAPQGMTAEVAFVEQRGSPAVLKRCRNPNYIEWLRREHEVLVALSSTSLPVPRVLGYHETIDGGRVIDAWLLTTRLFGGSLWDVLLRSAAADRRVLLRRLGALVAQVHATPPPEMFRGRRLWIDRMLAQARLNLPWCDGSLALLEELERTKPAPHGDALIHGDLALDNVLVAPDGAMSLIDWSGGDIGDPRYDIALALATEPELELTEEDVAGFFAGYGAGGDRATARWFVNLYEFF